MSEEIGPIKKMVKMIKNGHTASVCKLDHAIYHHKTENWKYGPVGEEWASCGVLVKTSVAAIGRMLV